MKKRNKAYKKNEKKARLIFLSRLLMNNKQWLMQNKSVIQVELFERMCPGQIGVIRKAGEIIPVLSRTKTRMRNTCNR